MQDDLCLQEAAQDLEQQLGDPAAVVLLGCPEASKVSMVASFSPAVSYLSASQIADLDRQILKAYFLACSQFKYSHNATMQRQWQTIWKG